VVVLVAACSGGDDEAAPTTTATVAAFEPTFAPGPCDERVPGDTRVECGTLTVLEDRDEPKGQTIRLPVAIVRSADPQPRPDPIVYLSGGPGSQGFELLDAFLEKNLAGPRDAILFDQRGTGRAEPSLECPEVDSTTEANFGTADPVETELGRTLDAYAKCRSRLVADGVDLDTYDSMTSADDVEDLRTALGIDEWNLFGVSYGTRLALQVLRAHPEKVRSAVLDSVTPTTIDDVAGATFDQSFERARDALFAGCGAAPACAAAYPSLEADVEAVVAAFNADPFEGSFESPDGRTVPIVITGNDIIAGLFTALYDETLIPALPSVAAALHRGDTGIIPVLAAQGIPFATQFADAMAASVQCADFGRARRRLLAHIEAALAAQPDLGSLLTASGIPQVCDRWDVPAAPGSFNEPVGSDLPVLVLGNEYDPVTPPTDSEAAAEALGPTATFVRFPGLGHGAVAYHPCPRSIFDAFLLDPAAAVDERCVTAMGPPAWVVP
jgi:pimeloyl-ACP methyl ester carboxylesterase